MNEISSKHKKRSGVYKIINNINSKIYIGSSSDLYSRMNNHKSLLNKNKHHSCHLQNAWNAYGCDSFSFIIVEEVNFDESISPKEKDLMLKLKEKEYIKLFKSDDNYFGYNIVSNPDRSPMFGRKHSIESRKKMSEWQIGENNNNYGKKFSEDHRRKISESHKGKKVVISDEQKEKISNSLKGKKPVKAIEKSIENRMRKICQYDINGNLIRIWNNTKEASDSISVNRMCIVDCCRGKQKTSKGFVWRYMEQKG